MVQSLCGMVARGNLALGLNGLNLIARIWLWGTRRVFRPSLILPALIPQVSPLRFLSVEIVDLSAFFADRKILEQRIGEF